MTDAPQPLPPEVLVELQRLLGRATKHVQLPLWRDSTESDGAYGSGPGARHGYKVSVVMDHQGRHVMAFDCYEIALIEEEIDEEGVVAWDTASFDLATLTVHALNNLAALISTARSTEAMRAENERLKVETGWLIEIINSRPSTSPTYFCGVPLNSLTEWPYCLTTTDHLRAVRFCRKADAEQVVKSIGYANAYGGADLSFQVAEHRWGMMTKPIVILFATQKLLKQSDDYRARAEAIALQLKAAREALEDVRKLPPAFQWTGTEDGLEGLFDAGMRHKTNVPFEYLKRWLPMFRPFAYATHDDSWGELEKLICITLRSYVQTLAKVERVLSTITPTGDEDV